MLRIFRVYGKDGHRQAKSFGRSRTWVFENGDWVHIACADETGFNDYTEMQLRISENAVHYLRKQVCDGFFEDSAVGKVTEVINGKEVQVCLI